MQISRSTSSVSPTVERPPCPRCGTQMWISNIEPDKPSHDRRTFECPRCQWEVTEVVKFRLGAEAAGGRLGLCWLGPRTRLAGDGFNRFVHPEN